MRLNERSGWLCDFTDQLDTEENRKNFVDLSDIHLVMGGESDYLRALRFIGKAKEMSQLSRAFRVGIAGPVGSGKTALVDRLSRHLWPKYNLAVVTNDIYTREDAEFLLRQGTLPLERVRGVETGGCPHSAIREDASMNLEAIADLEDSLPGLELIFVESGGDNLAAAFSPELVDVFLYVIDVSGGDKIPRKGGPGII